MRQLQALARPAENHCVLPDDIAFADRLNRNILFRFAHRFQNLAQSFCRPAWRIFFHLVMRFNDLGIEIPAEQFGGFACQPGKHINSNTEIGREHNRQRLRGLFDCSASLLGMTSRPNHKWLIMTQRRATDFSNSVRVTEIDPDVAIFHSWLDWVAQIASRDDMHRRIVPREISNCFANASSRSDGRYPHRRLHAFGSRWWVVWRRRAACAAF